MENRRCNKCDLYHRSEDAVRMDLSVYVDKISEDERVNDGLYRERLAQCEQCPHLFMKMCRLCGCFVEIRTAIAVQTCPAVPMHW